MCTFDRYLVVSEYGNSGYILGYYPSMEAAEKIMNEHIANYEQHKLMHDIRIFEPLFERVVGYATYEVHLSRKYHYLRAHEQCTSDGTYRVYILDTDMKGFSLEKFKRERATNICAFEFDEFDPEEHKYASLIAN